MKNKVKELREKNGYSQAKLGELLGVSRQTVNSLEKGRYNPSIHLAFKISIVFEQTIEEIFIYEGDESDD
jgi:putative transcriptional regulator